MHFKSQLSTCCSLMLGSIRICFQRLGGQVFPLLENVNYEFNNVGHPYLEDMHKSEPLVCVANLLIRCS